MNSVSPYKKESSLSTTLKNTTNEKFYELLSLNKMVRYFVIVLRFCTG